MIYCISLSSKTAGSKMILCLNLTIIKVPSGTVVVTHLFVKNTN